MSVVPIYEVVSDRHYIWSYGMIVLCHLRLLILKKYFTNVRICCFTRPVVSWAQVANSSHYNIFKGLNFPEDQIIPEDHTRWLKNSWRPSTVLSLRKYPGRKLHNDRQDPKDSDQIWRLISFHQYFLIIETYQPRPPNIPIKRTGWRWKQWQ